MVCAKQEQKYTGILAKPSEWHYTPAMVGTTEETYKKNLKADQKKNLDHIATITAALFKFYGRDIGNPEDWNSMVYDLAEAHVPAFRFYTPENMPKRGQPKVWDVITNYRLVADVMRKVNEGKTISEACLFLSKNDYKGISKAVLERQYRRAYKTHAPKFLHEGIPNKGAMLAWFELTKLFPKATARRKLPPKSGI